MEPIRLTQLTELFSAAADPTRQRLLALLAHGEQCVCHLESAAGAPQSTVSRHLAVLRRAGLVETRREGVWIHYRLSEAPHTQPVLRALQQLAVHCPELQQLEPVCCSPGSSPAGGKVELS